LSPGTSSRPWTRRPGMIVAVLAERSADIDPRSYMHPGRIDGPNPGKPGSRGRPGRSVGSGVQPC
jgi:hypothetical protein